MFARALLVTSPTRIMASPAALWDIVSKAKDPKTGLRAKRKKSSKKGADILDGVYARARASGERERERER